MGVAHSEILSSTPRSGSPRRATGGVCRRPHYPYPQYRFESFFCDSNNQPSGRTPVIESALPHPLPASGKFIGAVNIDSGGVNFLKEVKVSIPLPENLPAGAFVYVTQPQVHVNPDASEEQVYVVIDSTKIVDGRLSCASPPFDGIMGFGLYAFVMFDFDTVGVAYGTTYRDMDGDNIYTPGTDQPIRGAVIRCATAESFISYSGVNGHYAATLVGPAGSCNTSVLTATHPQTMQRVSRAASSCQAGTSKLDLKLADKETVIPDATAPTVNLALKVVAGQSGMIVAGTVPVGTELEAPISVIDQDLSAAYLTATFQTPEMATAVPITPGPTLNPVSRTLHTPMQGESPALFRYDYQPQFSPPLAGSTPARFRPNQPGVYKMTVEAIDVTGNRTPRTVQVRAINQGDESTSLPGFPRVSILPADGAVDVMITTQLVAWFSEPVENVTPATFTLTDLTTNATVPAFVYTNIEGGRMLATLVPQGNLSYARNYRATLSSAIRDIAGNPSGPVDSEGRLHLEETSIVFTTKAPRAFDLSAETTFSGGRDIDLYTPADDSGRTYAYVTAGWSGWRVIDVTDPTRPTVVHSVAAPPNWSYRGVAVEPQTGTLGMTLNISNGASQYGYVEFHDLTVDPVNPPYSGRDLLASAYSGIPGRLDLDGNYAYIATAGAGLQVVDIGQATADLAAPSRGQSIVGSFDSGGQGYGQPNDAQIYGPGKLLVTTNSGNLLLLSVAYPEVPTLSGQWQPENSGVARAAAVSGYQYTDAAGNPAVVDLALAGLRDGRVVTLDISEPSAPELLGTALDDQGQPVIAMVNDVSLNKEAGLAFVTTYSSIQVFDIKDPLHPRRLANLTQLPDESGDLVPIGSTPALIEQGGWLYLGSESKGLRTIGVDPNELEVLNEEKETVAELSYSKGDNETRRYQVVIKYDDPSLNCSDADLVGSVVVQTRAGGTVTAPVGIDLPSRYPLTFRKGSDGRCHVDLKTAPAAERFIVANFPAGELALTTEQGDKLTPLFGGIGSKAVFEFSSRSDGRLLKRKSIPLAKLIRVAFDGNRDGIVDFDEDEDNTYTFWVNDDRDVKRDIFAPGFSSETVLVEYDDNLTLESADADDDTIDTLRDLEDFAPLQVQIDKHAQRVIQALAAQTGSNAQQFSVHFQFKNAHGTTPEINLFEAVAADYKYQSKIDYAGEQMSNKVITTVGSAMSAAVPLNTVAENGNSAYLFEGKNIGSGDLTVVLKSDGVVVDENSATLDLKHIRWFYDKFQVKYNESTEQVDQVIDPGSSWQGGYQPRSNDYVFYVHGWNMSNGEVEKERWAETMFKRLWWQGYAGRVGLFSWPTLEGGSTYDSSEYRAWNSAEAFKTLLESDIMQPYRGEIRVLAHSMGGIVAGEAINMLPGPGIVNTYIASQAALSAHYYDNNVAEPSQAVVKNKITTPNIYGYYFSGAAGQNNRPYLSDSLANAKFINYYNAEDFALTKGEMGMFGWEFNNQTKPDDLGYSYEGNVDNYNQNIDSFYKGYFFNKVKLLLPDSRYEIFSHMIQSRTRAVGSTSSGINNFSSLNLKLLKYGREHYSHSKEFRSTIVDEQMYWTHVVEDFSVNKTTKRSSQ